MMWIIREKSKFCKALVTVGFLFFPRPSAPVNCRRAGLNAVKRTNRVKGYIHPAATSEMDEFLCLCVCLKHFLAPEVSSSALLIQHFNGLLRLFMLL